jgi:hypothetical protein
MDPVTLAALLKGAGKLIGAVGPAAGQFLGARGATEALKQSPEQIAEQYEELKSAMPQYGVGSAWNEYLAMSKQDPAADMERQIAAEQEASSVGALKAGGAKALLGGLGAAQRQAAQSRMGIEADSAKRQMSALQTYGAQQQRAQDMNTQMEQQLAQSQFQAERGAEQYNRQLEAQKKQAMGQALGAVAGQFGQGLLKGINFGGDKSFDAGSAIQSMGLTIDPSQVNPNPVMSDDMLNMGTQVTGLPTTDDYNMNPFGSPQPFPWNQRRGGMITEGAFSHETNPIDIMQDGAKVGEMTGGEAILNPEQQNKVAKQSPYFRKLMREFSMRNRR